VRILERIRRAIKTFTGPSVASYMTSMVEASRERGDITDPYTQNVWVKACVDVISNSLIAIPMVFRRDRNDSSDLVVGSSLEELLDKPTDQYSSKQELFRLSTRYLDSQGAVVWRMVGREEVDQDPEFIQVMSAHSVEAVKNDLGWIHKWKIQTNKGTIEVPLAEIVLIKYANLDDPTKGLAPIVAAMSGILIDWKVNQFNMAFFDNNAVIGGVLKAPENYEFSQEDLDRFRTSFSRRHGGSENAFKVAAFENGVSFEPLEVKHTDMMFESVKNLSKEEVLAAFQVPPALVGQTDDFNKANMAGARESFHQNTVLPRAITFTEALWAQWLQFRKENVWLEFDDSNLPFLQADYSSLSITVQRLLRGGFTRRQLNERFELGFDMDNDTGADVRWMPVGLLPEDLITRKAEAAIAKDEAMAALSGAPSQGDGKSIGMDDVVKLLECIKANGFPWHGAQPIEINPLQIEDTKKIGAKLKKVPKTLFNEKEMAEALMKALDDAMLKAASVGLNSLLEDIGATPADLTPDEGAWAELFRKKKLKIKTIPERWHKALRHTVAKGIEEGQTTVEITEALVKKFKGGSRAWAKRIADTEVMDTLDQSRHVAMKAEGVPMHGWLNAGDDAVRESHRINREVRKVGELFSNGLEFPHDDKGSGSQVINCRCTTFPVMDEEDAQLLGSGKSIVGKAERRQKELDKEKDRIAGKATPKVEKWFDLILKKTLATLRR